MDPFRVKFDPGVFRVTKCYSTNLINEYDHSQESLCSHPSTFRFTMTGFIGSEASILDHVNVLTISAAVGAILVTLALRSMVRPRRFPPGPRGWPFVGSIFGEDHSWIPMP